MSDQMETGERALGEQPFSEMLGTKLTAFESGYAELLLPITPVLHQQHGFVHGGVVGYMADCGISFAAGSVLGPTILTSEYKVNFTRAAQGERLEARGRVITSTKRQAVCSCEVWCHSEAGEYLCAVAQGTVVIPSRFQPDE